jgi:hypothetical protein
MYFLRIFFKYHWHELTGETPNVYGQVEQKSVGKGQTQYCLISPWQAAYQLSPGLCQGADLILLRGNKQLTYCSTALTVQYI